MSNLKVKLLIFEGLLRLWKLKEKREQIAKLDHDNYGYIVN
jgi:hypothetical protein